MQIGIEEKKINHCDKDKLYLNSSNSCVPSILELESSVVIYIYVVVFGFTYPTYVINKHLVSRRCYFIYPPLTNEKVFYLKQ